ncbi:Cys/Met metabolism PLP-dependent enzyme-domain-containing protein [Hyaloraphidium curvatum]|nr:Cys/Met metabolism PLP-dependent enzyme-domain-containing protein [Hyaloraphidium curvatum]
MLVSDATKLGFATRAIHADDPPRGLASESEVMAPLSLTTTFRHREGHNDWPLRSALSDAGGSLGAHIYSRYSSPVRDRVEAVLGALEGAHAVTYTSGLTAISALYVQFQPKRIIKTKEGYFGCEKAAHTYARNRSVEFLYLEDFDWNTYVTRDGDMILLESPQNPRNEFYDYAAWNAKRASKPYPATLLAVDATFAPPPLQYPLKHGADVVFHSSTKFLGGHSDLLGGVVCTSHSRLKFGLLDDRSLNGWVMGSLESWLLLRSLRTLEVRVTKQSRSAHEVVQWLHARGEDCLRIVHRVWHTSVPGNPGFDAAARILEVPTGSGCFSLDFKSPHHARLAVQRFKLFANATSLGGCESLAEWRHAVDDKTSPLLVRVSIGLEDPKDLIEDMRRAFAKVAKEVAEKEASGEFERWDLQAERFIAAPKPKI